jgi:hypothetical protein
MKKFRAIRKPIYLLTINGNQKDFCLSRSLFDKFVEMHPEYKDCKYDTECNIISGECILNLRLYRECAVDFVEE